MKKLLLLTTSIVFSILLNAQISVSGKILDSSDNEPIPGAGIKIINSSEGTFSNRTGDFSLKMEKSDKVLEVRYAGYESQTIQITGDTTLTIKLVAGTSLDEIVIIGMKAVESNPITQKTIERKEIEAISIGQEANYILERLSPSVMTSSDAGSNFSNYSKLFLRGVEEDRLNFTLNGVPLNDMVDQGIYLSNIPDFASNVSSIQIQRGVGTSSNGVSSFAGSVRFDSPDIFNTPKETMIELNGGSFNSYRTSISSFTGLNKNKTALYTRFSKTGSDGYKDNSSSDSYSFFTSGGYKGEKDIIKFTAFLGNSKRQMAYEVVPLDIINDNPKTNFSNPNDKDDYSQWLSQIQYSRILNSRISLHNSLYYTGAGGSFPWGWSADSTMMNDYGINTQQISYAINNLQAGAYSYLSYNDKGVNISGGIHAYYFRRKNTETMVPDFTMPYYQDKTAKNEISTFIKASYDIQKIAIFADLQYRNVNMTMYRDENYYTPAEGNVQKTWNFVSPKAGFTYNFSPYLNVYSSVGVSYREPSRTDFLGDVVLDSYTYSYASSDSVSFESLIDYEVGIRIKQIKYRIDFNLFYMDFTNEIATIGRTIPENYANLRKNMPKSSREGVELDAEYFLFSNLSVSGNLTILQTKISEYKPEDTDIIYTNTESPFSPKIMSSAGIDYKIFNRFKIGINGRYLSEMFMEPTNDNTFIIPSSFIVNAKFSASISKNVTFGFYVNNLTNKQYFTYGEPTDTNGDYISDSPGYLAQAPLSLFGELVIKF